MNAISRKAVLAVAVFSLALVVVSGGCAQSVVAGPAPKMAEEVFENIQAMKGMPAGKVYPTMDFFRASLGERCTFCHEETDRAGRTDRAGDGKPAKLMTRKMMQMVFAINKNTFDGRLVVTCYSCHRGSTKPVVGMPLATSQEPQPAPAEAEEVGGTYPGGMPTGDQLLDKYVTALGGAGAIQKISSRVAKGTVTDAEGRKFRMEVLAKAPANRLAVMHLAKGDSFTLYNGDAGCGS
jgi:photosynthetic reaction center cytochrome c subunit